MDYIGVDLDEVWNVASSRIPELLAVLEQPLQSVLPLRCFRRQPDKHEFVDCRPNVEALRNEEYAGTVIPGGPECTEVSWHRARRKARKKRGGGEQTHQCGS